MGTLAAVIFTDAPDGVRREIADLGGVSLAGLSVAERAALTAHRAGIDRIHFAGQQLPDEAVLERLGQRGLRVTATRRRGSPLLDAPAADVLVVIPADTVIEPAALVALIEQSNLGPGAAVLMIDRRSDAPNRLIKVTSGRVTSLLADGDAASTDIAILAPEAVFMVREAWSARQAYARLARSGILHAFDAAPYFHARLKSAGDAGQIEHAYLKRLNGGDHESFLTKQVRRFSIPLSRRLLRLPISANQVTAAGLAVSAAAALSFAVGTYWAGILGALLYYGSTVLDCSDGEVARGKYCESAFGCWFETAADYTSYVLILAGITLATVHAHGYGAHTSAAAIALVASVLVFVHYGYFRDRVARDNPGQFDDAVTATFTGKGPVYEFAAWAKQWIKRSALAHVLLALALVGQLHIIVFLWAFGASMAFLFGLVVHRFLVRRVTVAPVRHVPAGVVGHA